MGRQLGNYPEVTTAFYGDIVGLSMGWSKKAFRIVMGLSLGFSAAMVGVDIHEMNQNKLPTPASPAVA